ncbi:MAG: putative sugar O-methyltransferase [Candidatus Hodarchaeota archaeon]
MSKANNNSEELELMLEDMRKSDKVYQPSSYWQNYHDKSMEYISSFGIENFRSSKYSQWSSFGAVDDPLSFYARRVVNKIRRMNLKSIFRRWINTSFGFSRLSEDSLELLEKLLNAHKRDLQTLLQICFEYLLSIDNLKLLNTISDSCIGNPDLFLEYEGKKYTLRFLRYYRDFLYISRFVDFKNVSRVIEIGGGYGGMAEVIMKCHPHIQYINLDIPPQSYIAQQYLRSVFGDDRTCSYNQLRKCDEIDLDKLENIRFVVLCPWQFNKLKGDCELLISVASFQEMEPDIVRNYARISQKLVKKWIYIKAAPGREDWRSVKRQHYLDYFDQFELIDNASADTLPYLAKYVEIENLMFKRKRP